ncbi:MAG: TetR/AcrR family transcriptional regulator [Desulfobacteraceae bacterium]|nr:TetR/AcrR family transcriptional regulator [Desulfobacteraceae bacterium]
MKTKNPVRKRQEKQKAETYALILENASFLVDTKGFEKTTIRAVSSHAEIGLGTIYKHFKNKTSLLAAALHDDLIRLFGEATNIIPNGAIQKQFIHLAGFNYRFYTSRPKLSREYLSHITFTDDEWSQTIERKFINEKI